MRTVRLITMINAPVERCYRLALHAGVAREAWRHHASVGDGAAEHGELAPGEEMRWATAGTGAPGRFTETLTATRRKVSIHRRLNGERLAWGEIEQHFAPMNDGTRLREEMRFAVHGWWLRAFRERRMRRSLLRMMKARSEAIKRAAEGEGWRRFLLPKGA